MKAKWIVAGGIIVAQLALCALMVASLGAGMGRFGVPRFQWGGFAADLVSVTADEEQRFAVTGPAVLNVNKGHEAVPGNITVVGGPGEEVVVTAHKTAWASDEAAAQADLDKLKVRLTQNKNTIDVWVEVPAHVVAFGNNRPDTVDFTITVPEATSAHLETNFGDLEISGVQGTVYLQTNFGKVSATDLDAESLEIQSDFGEITLEETDAGAVDVDSNAGEITLNDVRADGAVTLETDFGKIEFENGRAESVTAKTNSGDLKLNGLEVEEALVAKSDFGGVSVTKVVASSYELRSNSGNLTLDGANGLVVAHTDHGNVTIKDATEVTLDLKTNSGNIQFTGSLGDGPHNVRTDFGQIRLKLPETTALTLDLETDFGRIRSDLPITLSGEQDADHWQGEINGGGPDLTAKTNSGDITLETFEP